MRRWLSLLVLLAVGALAYPSAQTLSSQVLQLLIRTNVWTGRQTFNDLRLPDASPADTSARLYQIGGSLYWNGGAVAGGGGGPALHTLLGSSHTDTTSATVVRGALITGQGGTPTWSMLTLGSAGTMLRSDGTDVAWGTDASALTALNATQLTSGTVPLARLSGITNTEIAGGAAIAWTKLDKTGSSLADLTTRSATDLTTGTLADARLSANVSLFGAAVDNAEITAATITFAKWASNACTAGQYPQYDGANWICSTVTPGSGTVTSVGLTMPAIFSVTGSPVTGSGTLAATLANQSANLVWAGPSTGAAAAPTFRSLVYADLPTSAATAGTYPKVTINAQGIVTGTANQITLTTDVTGVLPLANGGTGLNAASDDSVLLSNGTTWAAVAVNNCTAGLTYTTATNTFGCVASVASHALLSGSHSDTLAASVVRGDLIIGSSTPQWVRLAVGANPSVLYSNGSDPAWKKYEILLSGTITQADGSVTSQPSGWYNVDPSNFFLHFGTVQNMSAYIAGTTGRYTTGTSILGAALHVSAQGGPATGDEWYGSAVLASPQLQAGTSGTHSIIAAMATSFQVASWGSGTGTVTNTAGYYYTQGAITPSVTGKKYSFFADDGVARFDDGVEERGRTTLMGEWASPSYSAGSYTANGAMTWTVDSGDVSAFNYTEIGLTQTISLILSTTTVGGTPNTELRVAIPNSRTAARTTVGTCVGLDNSVNFQGFWQATAGNAYVSIYNDPSAGTNWTAATNTTQIRCDITVSF
jgi:hypothetical protein